MMLIGFLAKANGVRNLDKLIHQKHRAS